MPEKIDSVDTQPEGEKAKLNSIQKSILEGEIIESIREVYDPEIPVNVYDLGLIYEIDISDEAEVDIKMTLTSPNCPVAETLPGEVEQAAAKTEGVKSASIELVWEPPFTIDRIPEHVKLELGLI
jgi:FeS assembly SUF system protein